MLTSRWFPWALVLVLAGLLGAGVLYEVRHAGEEDARVAQAAKGALEAHKALGLALQRAQVAEANANRADRAAAASVAPHVRAVARTDSAHVALDSASAAALAAAKDTAATRDSLARVVERLSASAAAFAGKVQAERDSAAARIDSLGRALTAEKGNAAAQKRAAEAAQASEAAVLEQLHAEQARHPGVMRRAVRGPVATLAGAACGSVGYLAAGPIGAVGAALGCSALVTIFLP